MPSGKTPFSIWVLMNRYPNVTTFAATCVGVVAAYPVINWLWPPQTQQLPAPTPVPVKKQSVAHCQGALNAWNKCIASNTTEQCDGLYQAWLVCTQGGSPTGPVTM
eukprot:TRINITY_DN69110_c0_g1_i1.p1 TRINITY_DN69110_c0_g1~~TRINITY_DN69110_c0_g1_i1.p1  ORF type:complete len:106 (-),score=9.08 TRINITY_DN69110_c0_g1_i1:219-536(-)